MLRTMTPKPKATIANTSTITSITLPCFHDRTMVRNITALIAPQTKKPLAIPRKGLDQMPDNVLLSHGETPHYHRR